jgi:radical SAM superfamily enzyme YgiQ (UPF0313 family)
VLVFAILKGLTPPDVETALYDERLAPIPYDEPTNLLVLTVETYTARRAYQIAHEFRSRGVKVVMGGFHPTFMPAEAAHFADAVVVGDAESTWPQVVADARAGRLKPVYRSHEFPPLAGMRPDYSIFEGRTYVPLRPMQFSRGCRFNCRFCSIRAFYGPINWSCQISVDAAGDPELLMLMEKSGCMGALVGFESLNPANLNIMNKSWNLKWADYDTSIARLQDAGVMIYGSFVFGWDHDTPDVFDRTLEFAVRHKFILGGFNPLMPTPGTKMYEELKRENRLIYSKWWIDPQYRYGQATFHPRGMTADQLSEGCQRIRSQFSASRSIARRLFAFKTHLRSRHRIATYMLANRILRQEHPAKEGRPFGAPSEMDPFQKIERESPGGSDEACI